MNEKASVTKELNARHRKIIESLLKLPENRECADCKANANNCFLSLQRSEMGKCEFRYLYMHAMFWDPQKSWGTHIEGAFLISRIYTFISS
ncbi:hypothetical protein Gotri_011766 [Gossypium trilobum]|uniref:Uncharacterized protein n=1 Tax=Gossypium trilobum TaxID=34281 RepID=A0A7J9EUU7_9ROSI|nr:hypothetical protein [Gossypium trilobum]